MFHRRFWRRATWASVALFLTSSAVLATPASTAPPVLQEVSGSGNGTLFRSFTPSDTPLLNRFGYFFQNADHPLQRIGEVPLPQQSAIEIALADKNGDDPYSFTIAHGINYATVI